MNDPTISPVIDAHLHLWDLEHSSYGWLRPELGALHRSFLPEEAGQVLAANRVDLAVLVQAEDSLRDTDWLLSVADTHDWVGGVVGWVPLDTPDAALAALDRYAGTALCGIRHLVHDDPRDHFLSMRPVRESLALLAEQGLPFDVPDAWPRHLAAVAPLADELGELVIVVDHLAKPPTAAEQIPGWRAVLAEAAARPNVRAKLSGLQAPGRPCTPQAWRPLLETALELFGADRLMFGGDWPMPLLGETAGSDAAEAYRRTHRTLSELIAELSPDEQHAITSGTATRTYLRERR